MTERLDNAGQGKGRHDHFGRDLPDFGYGPPSSTKVAGRSVARLAITEMLSARRLTFAACMPLRF